MTGRCDYSFSLASHSICNIMVRSRKRPKNAKIENLVEVSTGGFGLGWGYGSSSESEGWVGVRGKVRLKQGEGWA